MFGDKGFFGGLFDFNDDGKLDSFERAADFAMFMEVTKEEEDADDASDEDDIATSTGCSAVSTDVDDFEGTGSLSRSGKCQVGTIGTMTESVIGKMPS